MKSESRLQYEQYRDYFCEDWSNYLLYLENQTLNFTPETILKPSMDGFFSWMLGVADGEIDE